MLIVAQATQEPRLARAAAMVADPARSRMLCHLLTGEYATAGELARVASVTPATASGHLGKLQQAGFVVAVARGRFRYFRLADADVAHALEALALVAERGERERQWDRPARRALRAARCCYGHLAGQLGVDLHRALIDGACLRVSGEGFELTPAGRSWLEAIRMAPPDPVPRRRYAYACIDWSERRDHLAGVLAESLLGHFMARNWLRKSSGRAVELTRRGTQELVPLLGRGRAT